MLFFFPFLRKQRRCRFHAQRGPGKRPLKETFPHIRSPTRDEILQRRICMAGIAIRRSGVSRRAARMLYEEGSIVMVALVPAVTIGAANSTAMGITVTVPDCTPE
jgi:hypothetical protein